MTTTTVVPRVVVVRIDGRPSRFALLVDEPAPGFYSVRLTRGGRVGAWRTATTARYFSAKVRRIVAAELVRDATARELTLGFVQTLTTAGAP